jgi:hypothetical protein
MSWTITIPEDSLSVKRLTDCPAPRAYAGEMQPQSENLRPRETQPVRLVLKKETLRQLTTAELRMVAGGGCSQARSGCAANTTGDSLH